MNDEPIEYLQIVFDSKRYGIEGYEYLGSCFVQPSRKEIMENKLNCKLLLEWPIINLT